jgi:hypothetical protein
MPSFYADIAAAAALDRTIVDFLASPPTPAALQQRHTGVDPNLSGEPADIVGRIIGYHSADHPEGNAIYVRGANGLAYVIYGWSTAWHRSEFLNQPATFSGRVTDINTLEVTSISFHNPGAVREAVSAVQRAHITDRPEPMPTADHWTDREAEVVREAMRGTTQWTAVESSGIVPIPAVPPDEVLPTMHPGRPRRTRTGAPVASMEPYVPGRRPARIDPASVNELITLEDLADDLDQFVAYFPQVGTEAADKLAEFVGRLKQATKQRERYAPVV